MQSKFSYYFFIRTIHPILPPNLLSAFIRKNPLFLSLRMIMQPKQCILGYFHIYQCVVSGCFSTEAAPFVIPIEKFIVITRYHFITVVNIRSYFIILGVFTM